MNKKAAVKLLSKEMIGLIVGAICILFLIFILVSLYFAATGNQNKKYAEASMKDLLSKEITRINNGGTFNEQGISVPNPTGWFVFSFLGEDLKPNLCTGQNCVCICEDVTYIFDWPKRLAKKCDDKGSCVVVQNLKKFDKIKIEKGGIALLIKKVNNEIEITRK
jgi:hypothetical protein